MSSYPTQEDEMRAKEADAQRIEKAEESSFLADFQSIPQHNGQRLSDLAQQIVGNFNRIMDETRQKPFERQEDVMAGMKRLFHEQINVIEARRAYTVKINPSTAEEEDNDNSTTATSTTSTTTTARDAA
jgi:hypothetical protein